MGEYQRINIKVKRRNETVKKVKSNLVMLRKKIKESNETLLKKRKPYQKQKENGYC